MPIEMSVYDIAQSAYHRSISKMAKADWLANDFQDLPSTGAHLTAVSRCNSPPTFVISNAGRNMRTHILDIDVADWPSRSLN
jgi:hypothetical protein